LKNRIFFKLLAVFLIVIAATAAILDVMIAQILGFHRCREEGLQPDSPSNRGIISRVVGDFRIHLASGMAK